MNRLVELGQLVDWYGAFLTQRQRSLVRQYAFEDCSLGEIAEREGISRQAVRDAITTAEAELRGMEQKLGLIEKNERSRAILNELMATPLDEHQRELAEKLLELSSGEEEA